MKVVLSAAAIALTMVGSASGQKYPSLSVEVIIPFAAGGGVDLIGRSVAASLAEQLGQAVVAQNREGAGGTIGFGALASAAPDGYTLGFENVSGEVPQIDPMQRYFISR